MRTIFKYAIYSDINNIEIHADHTVIRVGLDPQGYPCLWALVDTDSRMVRRKFYNVGTGWDLKDWEHDGVCYYFGSYMADVFIWHVFGDPAPPVFELVDGLL